MGNPINISLPCNGLFLNTLASLEQLWVCDVILVYLLVYEYHYIFIARLNYCTALAAALHAPHVEPGNEATQRGASTYRIVKASLIVFCV